VLYLSSRQTIAAYPTGGSSYTVARENLGIRFGLVAAAALFLDYVLNAAVAISAGVAALRFAMRMSPNVVAMHVSLEEEETAGRRRQWTEFVETPARRSSLRRLAWRSCLPRTGTWWDPYSKRSCHCEEAAAPSSSTSTGTSPRKWMRKTGPSIPLWRRERRELVILGVAL
jgi:hypothetical protein